MTAPRSSSYKECKGDPDLVDCDWLFDAGDPATGVEMAWVCQICGAVDIDREPLSFEDDIR